MVAALRIALPDGSIVDACPHSEPELFAAAQLGLGAIGVICEVTLQCVPAYRLELTESTQDLEQTVTSFLADASAIDHHEFFWFPRTRRATVRSARRLPLDTPRRRPHRGIELLQTEVLGNGAFDLLCRGAALVPPLSRPTAELASRLFAGPRVIDDSPKVFTAPRRVRFHESEWAIPAEHFEQAFSALCAHLEQEDVAVTRAEKEWPAPTTRSPQPAARAAAKASSTWASVAGARTSRGVKRLEPLQLRRTAGAGTGVTGTAVPRRGRWGRRRPPRHPRAAGSPGRARRARPPWRGAARRCPPPAAARPPRRSPGSAPHRPPPGARSAGPGDGGWWAAGPPRGHRWRPSRRPAGWRRRGPVCGPPTAPAAERAAGRNRGSRRRVPARSVRSRRRSR